jgi:hypothetical protein
MRSSIVIALLAAAALAAGTAAASLPTVQTHCSDSSARVKPSKIVIACGDGGFYATGLHWSSWTTTGARGRGTAHQNDCTPACFDGHFHTYRGLTIRLSRPHTCHGRREFGRLSWRYGADRPTGVVRSGFELLPCTPG